MFTVELKAEPVKGAATLKVAFSGTITDYVSPLEWLLDYKDGNVKWGEPPAPATFTAEHTYEKAGTYEAVLGSHDAGGHEAFSRVSIAVLEKTWWQQLKDRWDRLPLWQKAVLTSSIVVAAGTAVAYKLHKG